ncbi:MAG: hypothetical protein J1D86_05690 [Alistipes sp.]|nr:hypothetical protein [Alistipes sp.]
MKETVNDILAFKDSREKRIREFIHKKTTVGNIAIYKIAVASLFLLALLIIMYCIGNTEICKCSFLKLKCVRMWFKISMMFISVISAASGVYTYRSHYIKIYIYKCNVILIKFEKYICHYAELFALRERLKNVEKEIDDIDVDMAISDLKKDMAHRIYYSHVDKLKEISDLLHKREQDIMKLLENSDASEKYTLNTECKQLFKDRIENVEKKHDIREQHYRDIFECESEELKAKKKAESLKIEKNELETREKEFAKEIQEVYKIDKISFENSFDKIYDKFHDEIINGIDEARLLCTTKSELKILFSELIQKASQLKNPDMQF